MFRSGWISSSPAPPERGIDPPRIHGLAANPGGTRGGPDADPHRREWAERRGEETDRCRAYHAAWSRSRVRFVPRCGRSVLAYSQIMTTDGANADTVVEEIDEGTLRPRTHKVVRALHRHMRLAEAVQQRALEAFDRGEQNT